MHDLTRSICVFVIVTASATARADEPATANEPSIAKEHSDEGTKLYNVQQYDKAAAEFQAAYLLDAKPEYLYASAQAQRLAGDCTKALLSYRAYLRTDPAAEKRDKTEKNIERCTAELQAVQANLSTKRLTSDADVPDSLSTTRPAGPTRSYLVGHILVGVGVAAIGGGAYLYRKGNQAIESHNSAQTYDEFATSNAAIDDARRQQTVGLSALAAGGGLVLGGVAYYILRARTPTETTVTAQVKSDGTMVFIGRSF